jgi:glycosyltransferase involved in cell wall biosynthesis
MQIVSGTAINGAVSHCRTLSLELARAGHDVTLVSRPGSWLGHNLPPNVRYLESSLCRSIGELHRMSQHVRDVGYDVIHTHMSSAHYFGVLLRFLTGTPSVATAHRQCLQLHWMFNDRVIACSSWASAYQRRVNRVRADRIQTVHNFADVDRFRAVSPRMPNETRANLQLAPSDRIIGYVGELVERKGLQYLIRALPAILQRHPRALLLLVGSSPQDTRYQQGLRAEASRLKVAERIRWLGARKDIPELMQIMEFLALPSLKENMPICVLEAMALGLPVVATRVGGIPEAVGHHETGLLVPPRNATALAEALGTLLDSQELRERLGAHGRQRVDQDFSPPLQVQRIVKVLQEAAATRRRNVISPHFPTRQAPQRIASY